VPVLHSSPAAARADTTPTAAETVPAVQEAEEVEAPMAVDPTPSAAPQAPEVAPAPGEDEGSLEDYLESLERQKITEALEATRWNKTAAAKRLGITFRALRYRLKKLGME